MWWLLACTIGEPELVDEVPIEPPTQQTRPAMPTNALSKVAPSAIVAGAEVGPEDPMTIVLRVPSGVTIRGRERSTGSRPDDGSILQLELPVDQDALEDETAMGGSIGLMDPPRYCSLEEPCELEDATPGRWRAFRERLVGGETTRTELQLGPGRVARLRSGKMRAAGRVVAAWLPPDAPPIDAEDRVVFPYVGRLPGRATHWLPPPHDVWRPRVRWRIPRRADPACADSGPICWRELVDAESEGMRIDGGEPAFVRVVAPLDVHSGAPMAVKVTVLDVHSNPTRVTTDVDLRDEEGRLLGSASFRDDWTQTVTLPAAEPGLLSVRADTSLHVRALHHWTKVHPQGSTTRWRLAGDMHVHTSRTATASFDPSSASNDHRGGFARPDPAFDYLRAVAGFDWGALSEHASDHATYTLPADASFDLYRPEGLCAVEDDRSSGAPDWWGPSQRIARDYDANHVDFVTFPAYEWHGFWYRDPISAPLHRVVLFRDHDSEQALPMLPGTTARRPPQCLLRFLELSGRTPDDTVVFTHLMEQKVANRDWDLTYRPAPPYDGLVAADAAEDWFRGVEIFSTRNHPSRPGRNALTVYEGPDDPSDRPWTIRYGWRDVGAVIGVVGASDDHTATPGSDDLWPLPPRRRTFDHDPGGVTFVLASAPDRQGIFNGLRQGATCATSGPRAWLDFRIGNDEGAASMGQQVGPVSSCALPAVVELMVGRAIREVGVYGVRVGSRDPYLLLDSRTGWRREHLRMKEQLSNPVEAGGAEQTWLYYVRAFLGASLEEGGSEDVDRDAVWSTPIWVTWRDGDCR